MNTLLEKYYDFQKHLTTIQGISALLERDQESFLPEKATETRAQHSAYMSGQLHELVTSEEYTSIVYTLSDTQERLSEKDKRSVSLARKSLDKQLQLDKQFVEHFEKVKTRATQVRAKARKENNFSMFAPHLEEVFSLTKEYALRVRDGDPYDTLLDEYEEGTDQQFYDRLLLPLQQPLTDIIARHSSNNKDMSYHVDIQRKEKWKDMLTTICETIGIDFSKAVLGEVHHPFMTTIGPNDIRVNTRYDDGIETLYSTLHETGHGLYEQYSSDTYFRSNLAGGRSLGIHESQSRLLENMIGRSASFVTYVLPHLKEYIGRSVDSFTEEGLVNYLTHVEPGSIRVRADEVSYNLHILLRYELEKQIIKGTLSIQDLPDAWNEKMEQYLGITPSSDSEGCLQDVHWSCGLIGYFPTYMLGNIIAAQLFASFENIYPTAMQEISQGDFSSYRSYFKEHIRQHGSRYTASELVEKTTGKQIGSESFIAYIQKKYH